MESPLPDPNIYAVRWLSKDGRTMRPIDFDNPHLQNTIRWIEKQNPLGSIIEKYQLVHMLLCHERSRRKNAGTWPYYKSVKF